MFLLLEITVDYFTFLDWSMTVICGSGLTVRFCTFTGYTIVGAVGYTSLAIFHKDCLGFTTRALTFLGRSSETSSIAPICCLAS